MRILKWVAVVAVLIAVVATAVYLRRDSIARDVANSLLEERGFVAKELRVRALTPNRLELKLLVIESDSGARYEIRGLTVPLSVTGKKITRLSADELTITYDDERDSHRMLSTTFRSVLDLPRTQPGLEATVRRVALPELPDLANIRWTTTGDGQALAFTVDAITVEAIAERTDDDGHRVVIDATDASGAPAGSLDALLVLDDSRYSANGELAFTARAWLPLLRTLDLLPEGIVDLDADLRGPLQMHFDADRAGHARIDAQLSLGRELSASYRADSDVATAMTATSDEPLAVQFAYPDNQWVARLHTAEGVVRTDGLSAVPVLVNNLECRHGITCTFNAVVDSAPLTWGDYAFDGVSLTVPATVEIGAVSRIRLSSELRGTFTGLRTGDVSAATVTVGSFSGTEIVVDDDGWHCRIEELRLAFAGLTATDRLRLAPKVTLRELKISNGGKDLAANIAIAAPLAGKWNDKALSLPGAKGTFVMQADDLRANVDIVARNDAVAGRVALQRNTARDSGSLVVTNGRASFDRARLASYIPGSQLPFDVVQGRWDIGLELSWLTTNGIPQYRGKAAMSFADIGGTYTDIAVVGLDTRLGAVLEPARGLALAPSPVSIRLVEVGVPLENIAFDYDLDLGASAVQMDKLSMDVFGGKLLAEPFRYGYAAASNDVLLHAHAIQLQLMVDTLEFESLQLTGTISGRLPVTMRDKSITISGGTLQSDAGGGTIRYRAADALPGPIAPGAGIGAVTRALTNFEFESLSSTVDYAEGGDMRMRTRLVGINPDLDPNQPYAFNLNLENNIPEMLRSLRAVRSIEDILQQQTDK